MSSCVRITTHITCRCTTKRSTPPRERSVCQHACVSQHTLPAGAQQSGRRETRVRRRYVTDSYGWCADAHHHLRPRRCMDSNPQLVMRCAGAHHHCHPRRCVDSNHLRVTWCAGAHHHPRPPPRERSVCQVACVSQHTLRAGAQQRGQPPDGKESCVKTRAYHNTHYVPVHNIVFDERPAFGGDTRHRQLRMVCRHTQPPSSTPVYG